MKSEEILKLIGGNPLRLRETYFSNNYPELHEEICKFTEHLTLPFKQKLFHFIRDLDRYVVCKKCGGEVSFHRNWLDGYRDYCSSKCTQSNPSTKEKRKNTTIQKWGVDNISKLPSIKEKQAETNLKKYGTKSSFQNEEVKKKWRSNIKEKYNVEHIFQLRDSKEKSKQTSLQKWSTEHYVQSDSYKIKLKEMGFSEMLKKIYIQKHFEKYSQHNLEFISIDDRVLTLKSEKCSHEFAIHYDSLKRRLERGYEFCTICNPINSGQSQEEKVLIDWLKSIGVCVEEKDRSFGVELDVYLPNEGIALEFNGLYWHSELYKHNNYHLSKSKICKDNSIRLIHIWEDDWLFKQEIVKSIILNSLGRLENKIYARKCHLKELNKTEKDKFLDENHIQGKCISTINLGLFYEQELVSVMTFGKRKINGKENFELLRFCNKINHSVLGAASKLFNFFINNYKFQTITSFADVAQFNGSLYGTLGFEYSHRSNPNYWWVVDGIRHHRFTYNKKRLVKEGGDPSKTEIEIMYEKGYFRIFGCGQDKYIYTR